MVGLSVRTVFMNVFVNLIVLLYLLNNETSMMILISNAAEGRRYRRDLTAQQRAQRGEEGAR